MSRKLALKKLTSSDLTFFRWHFLNRPAGNQKAINLNADVLIDVLYPGLQVIADRNQGKILLTLHIFGPGLEQELTLARKIVKGSSYKNWRLNGEFIDNPLESPERFNYLSPNDFVLFDFIDENEPRSIRMLFIAQSLDADCDIHAALSNTIENRSMVAIGTDDLQDIVSRAHPTESHPIYGLILDEELEDIALGGVEGLKKLRRRPSTRQISPETLSSAKQNASKTGDRGEEFVCAYLEKQKSDAKILDYEWVSKQNAIAPYDFTIKISVSNIILMDVKSTSSKMENPIHISFNELLQICNGDERYDIYRVFEIQETQAKLSIAENIAPMLRETYQTITKLPDGVSVDSISVSTALLPFGKPIRIEL